MNNAKLFLFLSKHQKKATKYAIIHSKDDKAYVRPGTCEGLEKTRNVKILTLSHSSRARKLPLHDFPEAKVYCTPASHRIMRKATIEVEGSVEKLITQEDTHFVFSRPKHYTPSHGTTSENEDIRCSHLYPQKFEVDDDTQYTTQFRSVCRVISNSIVYFLDTSEKKDIERVKKHPSFLDYEKQRVLHLERFLNHALSTSTNLSTDEEVTLFACNIVLSFKSIKVFTSSKKLPCEQ